MSRRLPPWARMGPVAAALAVVATGVVLAPGCDEGPRPAAVAAEPAVATDAGRGQVPADAAPPEESGQPWRLGPPPPPAPRRVVTLAPNLTEMVLELGAGDRLVGVSRFDDDPAVAALPRVGGYVDPNLEAILGLRPDLLVVEPSPGNEPVVRRLAALGVPVRLCRSRTVAEVRASIEAVGADLGLPGPGRALSARLAAELAAVARAAEGLPRPRTLLVYGHEPLVVAGPGTFPHELLTVAGGENVVPPGGTPYPVLPLERVATVDPEVIVDFVIHGGGGPRLGPFERLAHLRAVREGRVVRVTEVSAMRPGPRLGEAARQFFRLLHPGPAAAARLEAARHRGGAARFSDGPGSGTPGG